MSNIETVALIGPTRYLEQFRLVERDLTLKGKVVLGLGVFGNDSLPGYNWAVDLKEYIPKLTALALSKIEQAERVYVVNPVSYIGEATKVQIAFAKRCGKPIEYMFKDNYYHYDYLAAHHLDENNSITCGAKEYYHPPTMVREKVNCYRCEWILEHPGKEYPW